MFLLAAELDSIGGSLGCGLIVVLLVVVGIISIDHKLSTLVKIQREVLKETKDLSARLATLNQNALEQTKALQWMIDNWTQRD